VIARLDGVPLEVQSGSRWIEVPGVAPSIVQLEVDRETAQGLFAVGTALGSVLELENEGDSKEIAQLTILGLTPSSNPSTTILTLVDRRFQWAYVFVPRYYNVRRKTPNRRRSDPVGNLPPDARTQQTVVSDDVSYAPWSINNGVAWSGEEVARDILDTVAGAGNWTDRDHVLVASTVPVENWEFNMQGDAAVAKLLAYLGGGANVYVDGTGQVILYDTQGDGEAQALGLPNPRETTTRQGLVELRPIVGFPLFERQDRRKERPAKIRILYERQVEARIDTKESDPLGDKETRPRDAGELLRCSNVIPVPEDGAFTVGDATRKVVRGTWLTLDDYIEFCNQNPGPNPLAAQYPLSRLRLRENWFGNALNSYGAPEVDRGGVWRKRIALLREHYRRTFLIGKIWRDRVKRIYPYRVGIEDPETGSRAPALAYQDYCVVHAWTPLNQSDSVEQALFQLTQNRFSNTLAKEDVGNQIIGTRLDKLEPAPAIVRVLDQDLGILQVVLQEDFKGLVDTYERSAAVARSGGLARFDQRKIFIEDTFLTPDMELSFLVTLSLGAPNNRRRFYPVEVTLSEAESLLPGATPRSQQGEGPVLELRVGLPRAVARFAWNDDLAPQFFAAFTEGGSDFEFPDLGDPVNLGQLKDIAKAFALREFMRYRDHPEGQLTTTFRPDATIGGTVTRVVHNFASGEEGGALTTVELAPSPPAVDAQALLPPDVRRIVEGFVDRE